jgi:hypothetical protein
VSAPRVETAVRKGDGPRLRIPPCALLALAVAPAPSVTDRIKTRRVFGVFMAEEVAYFDNEQAVGGHQWCMIMLTGLFSHPS